jgi:predicted enzyme related to lactoylglutathione lyase
MDIMIEQEKKDEMIDTHEELFRMSKEDSKFVNVCPVFLSQDMKQTVKFYTEQLGFTSATHFDHIENFATLYRDEVEFVIVQAKQGHVESNMTRYGAGYDAYIDTATPEGIDPIYEEFNAKGVKILSEPHHTDYGSYEFVIEDIDGRRIGIGRIVDHAMFFKDSERQTEGETHSTPSHSE